MNRKYAAANMLVGIHRFMKGINHKSVTIKHCLAVVALLISVCINVQATDYVFTYNNGYLANDNGTIKYVTTFDPSTCIWTCYNGTNEASLGTDNNNLRSLKNGSRYLNGSTTIGNAPTLSTDAKNNWRTDGNGYLIYRSGKNSYYLYYRASSWRTSNQANKNNINAYSWGTDFRATIIASTETGSDNTTAPTISCTELNGTTGIQLSRTNLTGTYTKSTTIKVSTTTYYKGTGTNGAYSTTPPSNTLNPTYTWSVTSGNATINQNGVVTPNNGNTSNITVRLTTTNANPAITKTTDFTINVSSTNATTTYSGGLSAVNPANNSIDYNGTTNVTLTSSARKKNATPAYQTYTASGKTFYRVNNTFTTTQPTATITDVALDSYSWTLSGGGASNAQLASTSGETNTLTYKTASPTSLTVTINVAAKYAEGGNISKTANVTLNTYTANPTAINADDVQLVTGETTTLSPTLICDIPGYTEIYRSLTYASANTGIATVDETGKVTAVAKGTTTITITAAKQGGGNVTKTINVTVAERAADPTITFDNATGKLTMSTTQTGGVIHYTLNGTDPTASSPTYNATSKPVLTEGATVKAITVADGFLNSNVKTLNVQQVATPTVAVEGTTVEFACATEGVTYYYTTDGKEPTLSSTSTTSTTLTDIPSGSTMKVMAVKDGMVNSAVTTNNIVLELATPTITIGNGNVTMTSSDASAEIHYTTDGSTPTASSPKYTAAFAATNGMTYKAIAVRANYADSEIAEERYMIASGVSGGTVILNDYEDHNWTYYKGVDASVDGGHYNTDYLNKMYSPDPRNVKITYRGGGVEGASAVAISGATGEGQNEMVYYETIEKTQIGETGNYAYHVIPNPFSKRPRTTGSTGTNGYYGFGGWKLVSGGEHISEYSNNDILPLEPTIHFTDLDDGYTPNCTSAEIVFEATWVEATVKVQKAKPTFDSGTYETNFWVLSENPDATVTLSQDMTFTQVTPDGGETADYRDEFTMTQAISFSHGDGVTPKIEFMKRNNGTAINPNGKNLYIGRGVTNSTTSSFYGSNGNNAVVNQVIRVESGNFGNAYHYHASPGSVTKHIFTWGCDYDRAKGINTNLTISEAMLSNNYYITTDETQYTALIYIKSGRFAPNGNDNDGGSNLYYVGMKTTVNNQKDNQGLRYMEIQGGELRNIAGASTDHKDNHETIAFRMRMKGGTIHGMAFGCARGNPSYGSRAFILTGGKSEGWISPGSNGNSATLTGYLNGRTYLYAGGNFRVDSNGSTARMNRSVGGNLFGSGCGYDDTRTTGGCELGSNVVVADNVYVERGVYSGGSFGYSDGISYIYVTGGHVAGVSGGISSDGTTYNAEIQGGVYGGSCQNKGNSANIIMTGGQVDTGIYGGSNRKGTMSGYTNILITGGTVNGNVHGGGYGVDTVVEGDVDINIGKHSAEANIGDAVINGDVYGGSALGKVNDATTDHTNVTLNAGTINGSLYGGALGSDDVAANVYGPVQVTVNGGTVNTTTANGSGAVYGCNNINGAPQSTVKVDIYGTDPAPEDEGKYALDAVYGGGNMAHYSAGTPQVTVHNCDNSIGTVYGGGNAADITNGGTVVTIYGGNVIGKVFGGGNGEREDTKADISGGTNVTIHGGTILDVYGGSNTRGTIGGTISVTVNELAETTGQDACPININNVFGGGNLAPSAAAKMTIGCATHVGAVYGGANQASITSGDIDLVISGGNIDNVFGGNNISGTISGTIKVTVNEDKTKYPCGVNVGNVYGAGNQAAYTNTGAYPEVNILNGKITGNVFGGGLGETAVVTSNPAVLINGGTVQGNVFGGGSEANTVGNPVVTMQAGSVGDAVYGGGALADVDGNTTVSLTGGTVNDVYGGGLGRLAGEGVDAVAAIVTGNTNVTLNGSVVTGSIFGCNNLNGTPQGHAKVTIVKTTPKAEQESGDYDVYAVYGGGNKAAYIPTSDTDFAEVEVLDCDNVIKYVYGGGNAASSPATQVTINGGRMYYVFGGGNGAGEGNPGADIGYKDFVKDDDHAYGEGTTTVNIYGGEIETVFGGSNTLGNIRTASNVYLDDKKACTFDVKSVYGAGNQAEMYGNGNLIIGCIPGLDEIYGGAKNADIHGDVTLTITNGKFKKIFGGNNLGGKINGTVTVNIEETGCRQIEIDELYGGGNLADYTAPEGKTNYPEVNVISATKIGQIFGGGKGAATGENAGKGKVTGNPHVNVNMIHGYLDKTTEQPLGSIGEIFGGGNAADVDGDTYVNIGTEESVTHVSIAEGDDHHTENVVGVNITGNVYGGGNQANVTGKTYVTVGRKKE